MFSTQALWKYSCALSGFFTSSMPESVSRMTVVSPCISLTRASISPRLVPMRSVAVTPCPAISSRPMPMQANSSTRNTVQGAQSMAALSLSGVSVVLLSNTRRQHTTSSNTTPSSAGQNSHLGEPRLPRKLAKSLARPTKPPMAANRVPSSGQNTRPALPNSMPPPGSPVRWRNFGPIPPSRVLTQPSRNLQDHAWRGVDGYRPPA